jgi:crotonobetainyl-CoA:carnitine CoA-transferase CaiB-like acyl-CoA transferase
MSITGEPDGEPMKTGVALVDLLAGKDAAIAILAAVAGRERLTTVQARQIHITLRDSALAGLINVAQNSLVSGREPTRWGNAHANLVPYQLFMAADRPFVIAVGADGQWPSAARALGLAELADDPSLSANAGRLAQRDRVVAAIRASVVGQPAAVWMAALDAVGVPCGLVRSVPDALGETAASAVTGVPPQGHGRVRFAPPRLDEHGAGIRAQQWGLFRELPILPPQPV